VPLIYTRPVAQDSPLSIARVSESLNGDSLEVLQEIAPNDPMYAYSPKRYFVAGPEALRCIHISMLAAKLESAERILDFGCGFGRVLRTLKAAFPDADLTACDIREDAVEFCSNTFGATPVVSSQNPQEIELNGPFDVIWSGSVLTHIDSDRWTGFLKLLESVLSPGGVLVFTTKGRYVAELMRSGKNLLTLTPEQVKGLLRDYDATGFGFAETGAQGGGDCVLSRSWVCTQLDEEAPELELMLYMEHRWLSQDVIGCTKGTIDVPPVPRTEVP
jgi:2-polyprenyl-3-methyl-5-hydroxy-6-metoxy-1,4-benzoquinol methylase